MKNVNIRTAIKTDAPFIYNMIKELAKYEKALDRVHLTLEQLTEDGFNESPLFQAVILELNNRSVGIALFYKRYSTWKGKSLYLEDLYITPEARGNKLGLMAMQYLANLCVTTNCERFEWQVLDWNEPSINFYKTLDTSLDEGWINCRLEGQQIKALASKVL